MAENALRSGRSSRDSATLIIVIGGLIIVALVGVIIALALNLTRGASEKTDETAARPTLVTEDNVEEIIEEAMSEEVTPPGYYTVSMNMEWRFPDGASPSTNAYVENVSENTEDVYIDVTLSDTGELIYSSPVIPIGQTLRNFALDKDLDAGSYDCVCTYHQIDENQNTLSTVSMAVTVTVES